MFLTLVYSKFQTVQRPYTHFVITFPIQKAEEIRSTLSGWHVKDYGSVYRWVLPCEEPLNLSWPAPNIQMTKEML